MDMILTLRMLKLVGLLDLLLLSVSDEISLQRIRSKPQTITENMKHRVLIGVRKATIVSCNSASVVAVCCTRLWFYEHDQAQYQPLVVVSITSVKHRGSSH
ncbi:hypothetical protein Q9966_016373 [Columba livia]|nr:hypothetical protein Q9966_016373 [Columba livia]